MTLLLVALVTATVLLGVRPAPARRAAHGLADQPAPAWREGRRAGHSRAWWVAGFAGAAIGLASLLLWVGSSAAVVATAGLIVVSCCLRLSLCSLADRRAGAARVGVAHACSVLAAQIRVGRVPAEALHGAADDCPVLVEASRAQDLGGEVTVVWAEQSALPGHGGLSDLARAWRVSTATGAPLAHSLEQVSAALAADVALRAVVAGELAAPRATGKIMAVLPLCGLGMGYFLGGDPVEFLLSSHWGWGCLIGGAALAAAGVLWIDKLARLAGDQG